MSLFISPIKPSDIVESSGKIYGFFHIGFMKNWEVIFNILVNDLKNSGLLEATEKIFVGTAGIPPSNFILPEKFLWVKSNLVLDDGENETIKLIYSSRMRLKGNKIWYIHTKGASRNDFGMDSWRDFMTYFVVKNWRICQRVLQSHDICSLSWAWLHRNYSLNPRPLPTARQQWKFSLEDWRLFQLEQLRQGMTIEQIENYQRKEVVGRFSGNFWWANGDYISKIDTFYPTFNPYFGKRHLSEFFLGRHNPIIYDFCDICQSPKVKDFNGHYYGVYIDPKWYEQPYFVL